MSDLCAAARVLFQSGCSRHISPSTLQLRLFSTMFENPGTEGATEEVTSTDTSRFFFGSTCSLCSGPARLSQLQAVVMKVTKNHSSSCRSQHPLMCDVASCEGPTVPCPLAKRRSYGLFPSLGLSLDGVPVSLCVCASRGRCLLEV